MDNKDLIEDAVNAYFHQAVKELSRNDIGDIEKRNWESIRDNCKSFLSPPPSSHISELEAEGRAEDWAELNNKLIDILFEANGTGSGADDITQYLQSNFNITRKK